MINTKLFRTILIVGSVLCTAILWMTRHEWQNSLSAFASSQNVVWYNMMHVLAISFFLLNGSTNERLQKFSPLGSFKWNHGTMDYIVGLGMGAILITNMYVAYWWHTIFTASTLAFAVFSIIFTAPKRELVYRWILAGIAIGAFVIGYFTKFHFLIGEAIAMAAVATAMLRQIWIYEKGEREKSY